MRLLPLLSNVLTLSGYALAALAGALAEGASSALSAASVGGGGEGSTGKTLSELSAAGRTAAALSPALLLLCADPLLFRGLSSPSSAGSRNGNGSGFAARRYAPPALAAALSLASATLFSLARDTAVRRRMLAGFPEAAAAAFAFGREQEREQRKRGGGLFGWSRNEFSSSSSPFPSSSAAFGVLGDSLRETAMVALALPAHLLLSAHLWTRRRKKRGGGGGDGTNGESGGSGDGGKSAVPVIAALAAMPPSALALAAARCPSTKWLAFGSVVAVALVAAQQGIGAGRSRRGRVFVR